MADTGVTFGSIDLWLHLFMLLLFLTGPPLFTRTTFCYNTTHFFPIIASSFVSPMLSPTPFFAPAIATKLVAGAFFENKNIVECTHCSLKPFFSLRGSFISGLFSGVIFFNFSPVHLHPLPLSTCGRPSMHRAVPLLNYARSVTVARGSISVRTNRQTWAPVWVKIKAAPGRRRCALLAKTH